MHLDDKELIRMQREEGARIIPQAPAAKPPAPPPSDVDRIISAIQGLGEIISAQEAPVVEVDVAAPNVEVKPHITMAPKKEYREWEVEVTERDSTVDHRIKKFRIKAVE